MIAAAWKKNDSLKHKGHVYSGKKTEDYFILGCQAPKIFHLGFMN